MCCSYSKYKLDVLDAIKQSGYIGGLSILRYKVRRADIAIEFKRVGSALLVCGVSKPGGQGMLGKCAASSRVWNVYNIYLRRFQTCPRRWIVCKLLRWQGF